MAPLLPPPGGGERGEGMTEESKYTFTGANITYAGILDHTTGEWHNLSAQPIVVWHWDDAGEHTYRPVDWPNLNLSFSCHMTRRQNLRMRKLFRLPSGRRRARREHRKRMRRK